MHTPPDDYSGTGQRGTPARWRATAAITAGVAATALSLAAWPGARLGGRRLHRDQPRR